MGFIFLACRESTTRMKKPSYNPEKKTVRLVAIISIVWRGSLSVVACGTYPGFHLQLILSWHQFVESLYSACLAYYEARQVCRCVCVCACVYNLLTMHTVCSHLCSLESRQCISKFMLTYTHLHMHTLHTHIQNTPGCLLDTSSNCVIKNSLAVGMNTCMCVFMSPFFLSATDYESHTSPMVVS